MSTASVPVLVKRIGELSRQLAHATRDLKSARSRNVILRGALQRARFADGETQHMTTIGPRALLGPMLDLARAIEEAGGVPALRFARDAEGTIAGLELATVTGGRFLAPRGEMAVVGESDDDDATGCPA